MKVKCQGPSKYSLSDSYCNIKIKCGIVVEGEKQRAKKKKKNHIILMAGESLSIGAGASVSLKMRE